VLMENRYKERGWLGAIENKPVSMQNNITEL
jgi:hypothetical protein